MLKRIAASLFAFCAVTLAPPPVQANSEFVTVASTTSTANSGLFEYLLPQYSEETGVEVRVIAVGTGQAIRIARKGDADVLLVHHRPSEDKFIKDGFGSKRYDVMYNDFIIVGPLNDPAQIKGCQTAADAMRAIKNGGFAFASRGDDSGTHKREISLWKEAGFSEDKLLGSWYRATGSGMGATLNIAAGMNAYALTDRSTWISHKNKAKLAVLCEGDTSLFNQYGIIAISKRKFPHIKNDLATQFIKWMISPRVQKRISNFRVNGEQLFTPNAK